MSIERSRVGGEPEPEIIDFGHESVESTDGKVISGEGAELENIEGSWAADPKRVSDAARTISEKIAVIAPSDLKFPNTDPVANRDRLEQATQQISLVAQTYESGIDARDARFNTNAIHVINEANRLMR